MDVDVNVGVTDTPVASAAGRFRPVVGKSQYSIQISESTCLNEYDVPSLPRIIHAGRSPTLNRSTSRCATAVPAVSAHPVPRVYEATSVPVHANPKQLA